MRHAGRAAGLRTRLRGSQLVRNTTWMAAGHGARLAIQAVYFVIVTRTLRVEGYGLFVGVTALVAIASPFASLGRGNLLIKNVAKNPALFPAYWGSALRGTALSGLALSAAALAAATFLFPGRVPPAVVLLVALSDLLAARFVDVSGQAYQAVQRLERTAQLQVGLGLARLLAVAALARFSATPTVTGWAVFYFASAVAAAVPSVALACRELGMPARPPRAPRRERREGLYFSLSLAAQSVYNDLDKTMLARLASFEATGIYAAAYRLIDVTFTPVRSLLWASYTTFFRHGAGGVRASAALARRLLPAAAAYSAVVGAALFVTAPLLPRLIGADYASAADAVRWLALLPLLRATHYFAADALTGAGHQGARTAMQAGVAAFNIAANLWLIPAYSWRGAAWASLASDALLAGTLWATVWYLAARPSAVPSFAAGAVK